MSTGSHLVAAFTRRIGTALEAAGQRTQRCPKKTRTAAISCDRLCGAPYSARKRPFTVANERPIPRSSAVLNRQPLEVQKKQDGEFGTNPWPSRRRYVSSRGSHRRSHANQSAVLGDS